eukprot:scaffold3260_cov212-Isochrysis_galbana.AAC.4
MQLRLLEMLQGLYQARIHMGLCTCGGRRAASAFDSRALGMPRDACSCYRAREHPPHIYMYVASSAGGCSL